MVFFTSFTWSDLHQVHQRRPRLVKLELVQSRLCQRGQDDHEPIVVDVQAGQGPAESMKKIGKNMARWWFCTKHVNLNFNSSISTNQLSQLISYSKISAISTNHPFCSVETMNMFETHMAISPLGIFLWGGHGKQLLYWVSPQKYEKST